MKKILFPVAALAILVSAAACGGSNEQHPADVLSNHYLDSLNRADSLAAFGTPVEIAFDASMDKANDGKRVSVIGYLNVPDNSYSTGKTGQLGFNERPNQMNGAFNYILSIPIGPGKNTMKALPDKYTTDDVVVTDKNGVRTKGGDRVKLTGKLNANETYASLDVQEIEKMEDVEINYSTLNAIKITNSIPADAEGKLVTVDGTLEMPVMTMGGDMTFMYLNVAGMDQMTVNIAYGSGTGQLEPLPENYSDKDVKIRNPKGETINLKKKVRLYGIWKNDRVEIEAVENI